MSRCEVWENGVQCDEPVDHWFCEKHLPRPRHESPSQNHKEGSTAQTTKDDNNSSDPDHDPTPGGPGGGRRPKKSLPEKVLLASALITAVKTGITTGHELWKIVLPYLPHLREDITPQSLLNDA